MRTTSRNQGAARSGGRALREYLEREAAAVNGVSRDDLIQAWSTLFCEADRRAVSGAYAEHTVRQIERSLSSGIWGWLDDDLALVADWGFELDQVAAPIHIWHGAEDHFIPVSTASGCRRMCPVQRRSCGPVPDTSRSR